MDTKFFLSLMYGWQELRLAAAGDLAPETVARLAMSEIAGQERQGNLPLSQGWVHETAQVCILLRECAPAIGRGMISALLCESHWRDRESRDLRCWRALSPAERRQGARALRGLRWELRRSQAVASMMVLLDEREGVGAGAPLSWMEISQIHQPVPGAKEGWWRLDLMREMGVPLCAHQLSLWVWALARDEAWERPDPRRAQLLSRAIASQSLGRLAGESARGWRERMRALEAARWAIDLWSSSEPQAKLLLLAREPRVKRWMDRTPLELWQDPSRSLAGFEPLLRPLLALRDDPAWHRCAQGHGMRDSEMFPRAAMRQPGFASAALSAARAGLVWRACCLLDQARAWIEQGRAGPHAIEFWDQCALALDALGSQAPWAATRVAHLWLLEPRSQEASPKARSCIERWSLLAHSTAPAREREKESGRL